MGGKMKIIFMAAFAVVFVASIATAQEPETPTNAEPVVASPGPPVPTNILPANTEITLSMNEELSSRRNRQGETFHLTVVGNVMLGNYIVIPAGTRAVGEITWMTGRGMFGKSGKMNVAVRYIDLNGRHIPVDGTFRQEGEGNTVATLAGVAVVPVAGLFITGRSAVIPAGRLLRVHLRDNLPVILPDAAAQPAQADPAAPETVGSTTSQQPAPSGHQ